MYSAGMVPDSANSGRGLHRPGSQECHIPKFLFDCYTDAMKTSYGHLFVNLRPAADDNTRIRSKMFDSPSVVYVPRK